MTSNRYANSQGLKLAALALLPAALLTTAHAEDTNAPAKTDTSATTTNTVDNTTGEKPAPLPLHQIEGNGGIFSTLSAYLVNPPRNGEWLGRPSVGLGYVDLGHGQNLEAVTLTETPWKRLELGYGFNHLNLGDFQDAVYKATGASISSAVEQHNFNARLNLLAENEFDQKWLPAVTFGVHYKYNDTFKDLNKQLGGGLTALTGISHNDGVDYTLYASKLFTQLPRPVLVELGGRATKGAQLGLLGYTDDYSFVFEGNIVVFLTSNIALAAEYKQKPNEYKSVGSLIRPEDDWWTIDAAYVVNKHLTLAAGYGHFGRVLNHEANGVWGVTTKWEF